MYYGKIMLILSSGFAAQEISPHKHKHLEFSPLLI